MPPYTPFSITLDGTISSQIINPDVLTNYAFKASTVYEIDFQKIGSADGKVSVRITEINKPFVQEYFPSQTGNSGKFLTTDGSTLSWAEVQSGGGTSIISTVNTIVAPDTTSVNTGTDLSDDKILGVYINGLYQIDSSDYTMSTSGGESTIELATTYSTTVALNVVYATSVDIADLSYNDLSNKPSINGVTLSGDISLSSLGIQSQNLSFMNIEASTWSVSEAYPDYAYECSLPCTGVTTNSFAQVVFSPEDAASGNYANICATSTNSVTIYGKVDTTITIPTIIVMGV